MAGGENYIMLGDGTIVGAANPLPTQGVAGATADVKIHGNAHTTQWIEPDADGRVTLGAGATLRTGQVAVAAGPAATLVLGANSHRSLIRIRNLSAHTVYIGKDNTVLTSTGHALPTGVVEDFPTQSAVWVNSANAADAISYAEFAA